MRKLYILLLIICPGLAQAQTYLKAADREEFKTYQNYCNDSILVPIVQYGKVTIVSQSVLGLDFEMAKMMDGTFSDLIVKPDTFWYSAWKPGLKATKYTIESNQVRVTRIIRVKVPRRVASVKDFYLNWKTGFITDWSLNNN
jgi:hypothetical protein